MLVYTSTVHCMYIQYTTLGLDIIKVNSLTFGLGSWLTPLTLGMGRIKVNAHFG